MSDDLDLEKELAKSIAHIVDEETTGAEVYVKSVALNENLDAIHEEDESDIQADDIDITETEDSNKKVKHLVITISIIVAVIAIIVVGSYFIVKAVYNRTQDNYANYHNAGFNALEQKDYAGAATNFEKALTYEEGKTNSDMMLYLYECYQHMGRTEESIDVLYDVIALNDKNYYNALYYLVKYYDDEKDYESIKELYDDNADSTNEDVIALFSGYLASAPVASPLSDTYGEDQKVTITAQTGSKIFYTVDGSDPTVVGVEYTGKIDVTEGTTKIRFYAVNEYGFVSDVVEEEYIVNYEAPNAPTIYPEKTNFEQINEVMVTINNYPSDAKVYYTLDGTAATEESTVYTGAFPLPAGSTIINVLVVDSHGLTCRTSKTYNVTYISNITEKDALEKIWDKLEDLDVVNRQHYNEAGDLCELQYYSKKTINELTVYMYYFSVDGVIMDYWYGADDSNGDVYRITETEDGYEMVLAHLVKPDKPDDTDEPTESEGDVQPEEGTNPDEDVESNE